MESPLFILFLVFLVLKLVGFIDWSWWWVTAPVWGAFVFFLVVSLPVLLLSRAKVKREFGGW